MAIDETWLNARAAELRTSFLFLTRLRYGPVLPVDGAAIAQAAWAFPVAGIVVGVIGGLVYLLAHRAGLLSWPAAALAVAATMAVSGCQHEDGLSGTVDGFGGGTTREQKLEIMRAGRVGVFGVCALVLSIMLRVSALASLPTASVVWALIAAHAASRAMLPLFMAFVPPVRPGGPSFAAGQPPRESAIAAAALGIVVLLLCLGPLFGIVALIVLVIAGAFLSWLSVMQIDGQTGEVLGTVEQVSEIAVLLVALR